MKIGIVGSGHGGCAMAAVLTMHGHEVNIVMDTVVAQWLLC
jgi:phytoene dehydrogenase-like protein